MADIVNPWTYKDWNVTAQGQFMLTYGQASSERAAAAANTYVGGPRPKPDHNITVHQNFIFRKTFQRGGAGGGGLVGAGSSGSGPPE